MTWAQSNPLQASDRRDCERTHLVVLSHRDGSAVTVAVPEKPYEYLDQDRSLNLCEWPKKVGGRSQEATLLQETREATTCQSPRDLVTSVPTAQLPLV